MDQKQFQLMQVIERIAVFKGLELAEVQQILGACQSVSYEPNQVVYRAGDSSTDMVILLKGQFVVTSGTGEMLGQISAGHSAGEMGLFSGRPRSANVMASVSSGGLVIDRQDLRQIFKVNPTLHLKVVENALALLCERLAQANVQIEHVASGSQKRVEESSGPEKPEGE